MSGARRAELPQPLYNLFNDLELRMPAALQGAIIPPGESWNDYAALVRLLQNECDHLLIVDPHVSADIFIEFLPHAVAKVATWILTTNQPKYDAPRSPHPTSGN